NGWLNYVHGVDCRSSSSGSGVSAVFPVAPTHCNQVAAWNLGFLHGHSCWPLGLLCLPKKAAAFPDQLRWVFCGGPGIGPRAGTARMSARAIPRGHGSRWRCEWWIFLQLVHALCR
ncbi:unnamed protein product, partial [Polarella glacialis]